MPKKQYWVDINSFEVEANDEEEAYEIAVKTIKDDPSLALDFEIVSAE